MKERDIIIDIGLDDDLYSSVNYSDYEPHAKIYIKNGEITSIMRIQNDKTSFYSYKKAMIHSKFLFLTSQKCIYHTKNHRDIELILDTDLSKCKQGYYFCDLPLILKHQIV